MNHTVKKCSKVSISKSHQKSQGKLVRVVKGEVYDVCVDLRINSNSFGKWFAINLSEKNKKANMDPTWFCSRLFDNIKRCDFNL